MTALPDLQESVCRKLRRKLPRLRRVSREFGISSDFDPRSIPINGLRHPPEGNMTDWYIWSTETFSEADDFLMLLCASHLT